MLLPQHGCGLGEKVLRVGWYYTSRSVTESLPVADRTVSRFNSPQTDLTVQPYTSLWDPTEVVIHIIYLLRCGG